MDLEKLGNGGLGLDDLMRQFMDPQGGKDDFAGLDGGGALKKQADKNARAMEREKALFRRVFSTEDGLRLLNLFCQQTLLRRELPIASGMSVDAIAVVAIAQQSQDQFVMSIIETFASSLRDDEDGADEMEGDENG